MHIQIKNLSKKYLKSKKEAVKNFTLNINKKEFVVILGPSGCGKTTILRMIAGLESMTTGEILIDGRPINMIKPKDRNISMVFQEHVLYPHLSVYENLIFPLKNKKLKKKDVLERVFEVAELFNICDLLERFPNEISGGQCQRVALARAIIKKPNIYLFDEPLSNLDVTLRNDMRNEILKLYDKADAPFIYVTHDQQEALSMATKIIVMKNGNIQQEGTGEELFYEPRNKFIAEFIGQYPMNFVQLKITDSVIDFLGNKFAFPVSYGKMNILAGFRPFDMVINSNSGNDFITFFANILEVQFLGHCYLYKVITDIEKYELLVCNFDMQKNNYAINSNIKLSVSKKNIYFFDEDSGELICFGGKDSDR